MRALRPRANLPFPGGMFFLFLSGVASVGPDNGMIMSRPMDYHPTLQCRVFRLLGLSACLWRSPTEQSITQCRDPLQ